MTVEEEVRTRPLFDGLRTESTSSSVDGGGGGDGQEDGSVLPSTREHVVTADDDFNSLSILFDMSLSDLKRLNRLFGQNHLPPVGSLLKVTPGSRTMQRVRQQKLSEGSSPGLVVRAWEN